jgi:hypothetical protein
MSSDETTIELPCRYLRNKEMYYQGSEDDEFASGLYWCNRTQESFGPDGAACGKLECCATRACYLK